MEFIYRFSKKNMKKNPILYFLKSMINVSYVQIVNIIEDDNTCFNTRLRVPYRIIVETIRFVYILYMKKSLNDLKQHPILN